MEISGYGSGVSGGGSGEAVKGHHTFFSKSSYWSNKMQLSATQLHVSGVSGVTGGGG